MKANFELDIQSITDKFTIKIDSIFVTKEKEILSV
jgi:ribosome recycling factor